ncbi:hypothetical protein RCC89_20610 [Cytophagaceae bacterium ABcell3]|nr:hypothetical protein RCC89_20610 [Cytophagaceae bacterium ABcell3]
MMKNIPSKTIGVFVLAQLLFMIVYSHSREHLFQAVPGHALGLITTFGTTLILTVALLQIKKEIKHLLDYKIAFMACATIAVFANFLFQGYWLTINIGHLDGDFASDRLTKFSVTTSWMLVVSATVSIFFRKTSTNEKNPLSNKEHSY